MHQTSRSINAGENMHLRFLITQGLGGGRGFLRVAGGLAVGLRTPRQRTAGTACRAMFGGMLLGIGLSLPPLVGQTNLAMTQPPRSAPAHNMLTLAPSATWQVVAFDAQRFLHLPPGWYRVKNSQIYFVIYPDMAAMARGLDRVAYFVEKSATKGTLLLRSAMTGNAFFGHDYSLDSIAQFFNKIRRERLDADLFDEERHLREQLFKTKLLRAARRGTYQGQKRTALLGFTQAEQYPAAMSPTPQDIYTHEIVHGLWFTTDYCHEIAAYWQRIPVQEQHMIKEMLYQRAGYDPKDLRLMQREFASYFRDYEGHAMHSSGKGQQLAISQLEAYQRELRHIEHPYMQALTQHGRERQGKKRWQRNWVRDGCAPQ
jgi:hypothetical protein